VTLDRILSSGFPPLDGMTSGSGSPPRRTAIRESATDTSAQAGQVLSTSLDARANHVLWRASGAAGGIGGITVSGAIAVLRPVRERRCALHVRDLA
jgi:hypothetical protein